MNKLEKIKGLAFNEESFRKFDDPTHPQYQDYKDRIYERWHDQGWNNAIERVLEVLSRK